MGCNANGTLGWTRTFGILRWPLHWRHPGPKWTSACPLLHHRRPSHLLGQRSWGQRHASGGRHQKGWLGNIFIGFHSFKMWVNWVVILCIKMGMFSRISQISWFQAASCRLSFQIAWFPTERWPSSQSALCRAENRPLLVGCHHPAGEHSAWCRGIEAVGPILRSGDVGTPGRV